MDPQDEERLRKKYGAKFSLLFNDTASEELSVHDNKRTDKVVKDMDDDALLHTLYGKSNTKVGNVLNNSKSVEEANTTFLN